MFSFFGIIALLSVACGAISNMYYSDSLKILEKYNVEIGEDTFRNPGKNILSERLILAGGTYEEKCAFLANRKKQNLFMIAMFLCFLIGIVLLIVYLCDPALFKQIPVNTDLY